MSVKFNWLFLTKETIKCISEHIWLIEKWHDGRKCYNVTYNEDNNNNNKKEEKNHF